MHECPVGSAQMGPVDVTAPVADNHPVSGESLPVGPLSAVTGTSFVSPSVST
jgi:hypothetical protein